MLENFAYFLQNFGFGVQAEVVIAKLYDTYRKSVESGTPYNYIDEVISNAGFSELELKALDAYLNGATSILLWAYVTQADAVKGLRRNDAFKSFRDSAQRQQELQEMIDSLKGADRVTQRAKNYIIERTAKPYVNDDDDDTLQILNFDNLKYLSKEALTSFLEKLQTLKLDPTKVSNLVDFLKEAGNNSINVVINPMKLFHFTRVAKKSLGRDLVVNDNVKLMIEADNINNGTVLNEKDGLYVEVPEEIIIEDENTLQQIWNLQKLFLSLGFEVSEQGLSKYFEINGSLDGIRERALAEKLMQDESISREQPLELTTDEITRDGKIVEPKEKTNAQMLSINNNIYRKVADGYYISAKESLTTEELSNYLNKKGIKGKDYIEAQNAITSIKKATNKNKEKVTCE